MRKSSSARSSLRLCGNVSSRLPWRRRIRFSNPSPTWSEASGAYCRENFGLNCWMVCPLEFLWARRDFSTAGSVMFLLSLGELLEEWTHKKSVDDLARCMSLNVDRVWLHTQEGEVLVPLNQIQPWGCHLCADGRPDSGGWHDCPRRGHG